MEEGLKKDRFQTKRLGLYHKKPRYLIEDIAMAAIAVSLFGLLLFLLVVLK